MRSQIEFPPVESALEEPNGLLATGGNLHPETLLTAYARGIFPWYSDDQPIMWWSPDPRAVLYPSTFSPSKSLKKTLRRCDWTISLNRSFEQVVRACAIPRQSLDQSQTDESGSWITSEMLTAYCELHELGHAHSIEVWQHKQLIGGLYGVHCGHVFSGESMFHRETDASKVAFAALCHHATRHGITLIDCQVSNPHLTSLGAVDMPRSTFIEYLTGANHATIHPATHSTTHSTTHPTMQSNTEPVSTIGMAHHQAVSSEMWREITPTHAADYIRLFDEHNQ